MKLRGIIALALALACSPAIAQVNPGTSPLSVAKGGTGRASFTANLPAIGNGTGALALGTRSGNTTQFVTGTSPQTASSCVSFDASGNLTTVAAACQSGTFTPTNTSPASVTIQQMLQKMPVMCETYSGGCTTANITQAMKDAITDGRCFDFNATTVVTGPVTIDGSALGGASNLCLGGRGGLVGPASGTFDAVLELKNLTGVTVNGNVTISCNANAKIGAGLKVWSSGVGLSAQFNDLGFAQFANCRSAIQIGDSSQSTLPLSEINISKGFFYNVAQGIRVYSSNAVVNIANFTNHVDPSSSGNWNLSATGTCTTSTVTLSSPGANSYFDQYDVISGTGVVAGTYITGQVSGTLGGAGVYNLSTTGNSCSAAAITGQKRGINIWTSGGTVSTVGGEVVNTVVNNGYLCVVDVMASPNAYGNCMFTGSVLEAGGSYAASFNPTAIVSPTGGGLSFVGNRGFVGGLTTTDLITTDSSFPGNISVANNRFFGTASRTGRNIVANTSSTKIYFDLGSFGDNMLQGASGVSGGTQFMQSVANAATSVQAAPSNPTGTASGSGVMMGMGGTCKITPASTGRVQVWFVGVHSDTAAAFTHTMNVRYGTGSAPANGAALTGTVVMANNNVSTVIASSTGNVPSFNLGGIVNGMTVGTAYWLDMNLGTGSGGTGSISGVNCTIVEF